MVDASKKESIIFDCLMKKKFVFSFDLERFEKLRFLVIFFMGLSRIFSVKKSDKIQKKIIIQTDMHQLLLQSLAHMLEDDLFTL